MKKSRYNIFSEICRYLLVCTITLLIHHSSVQAQTGKLFNADNQLSSSNASNVFQDDKGFIWVATRNGLNRYDGYKFKIFKKENESEGLSSNYINCVVQNRKGQIFVGNNFTVQLYDGSRFRDFQLHDAKGNNVGTYVNYIYESRDGEMLICTSGYGIMRLNDDMTSTIMTELTSGQNYVRYLLQDNKRRYWVVTENNGLLLKESARRTKFFTDEDSKSFVSAISQAPDGIIYAIVNGKGLFRFNEASRQFEHIAKTNGLPVVSLTITREGNIFLGCDGQGPIIYNPKTDELNPNPFFSRDFDISKGKVNSIVEDRNGNIWVAMLQKGVFMQPRPRTVFGYMGYRLGARNIIGSNCVTSTLIDHNGQVWVGTDKDALYQVNAKTMTAIHHQDVPSTLLDMVEDTKGHIWLGSYAQGCGWIDPQTGSWHPEDLGLDKYASIFGMVAASNGDVWIGTMGNGLIRKNVETGAVTRYTMQKGADNDRKMNSLPNNFICKICLSTDQKRLFVATSVGLCCLDIEKNSWVNVFGSNCPNHGTFSRDVLADAKGRVWLATNDGLYCYSLKTKTGKYYTTHEGLPDNGVASIMADKQGNLWLGTDGGLCCFNPEKETCLNYYVDDGLQGSEFSDGSVSISPQGTLIFGGTGGITWFNPSEIKPNAWKAKVHLTEFLMGNEPVMAGSKSGIYTVTDSTVISSSRFDLSASDNSFTIQLSTLTYDNPEHIIYMYSINGEEWTRLQKGVNEITFSHLSPGTYRFRVKAMNNQQETEIREFTVRIHSPWYASTWACLVYLMAIAAAVYALIRNRRRKEQDRLRLQEHIHAEEMSEAKLRFFMNISHEIRTPMTLIITPLLSLMKEDTDPQRHGVYEIIKRNAERILHLINQMMDLRKIDKGLMTMHMRETDLVSFVGDLHELFGHQAKAKNISLVYEHDCDELPVWIDRQNFDKVVMNILSNAFKYTPAGGKVNIRLTHDDREATLSFKDSGEGIPADKLQKIFERFYQSASTMNERSIGTGIGLDLTRSLVELHHGTITARNNEGEPGSEFVITLPLGKDHLKPEEILDESEVQEEKSEVWEAIESEAHAETEESTDDNMTALHNVVRKQLNLVIVEDDDEIAGYLLTELGKDYTVTRFSNGKEALPTILQDVPDLVISDVMMPEMDGNTLCSRIKNNVNTNHVPVILLTAKNREEDQLEGLETGADAYLVKPFNMEILRRTIFNLLNARKVMRYKYTGHESQEDKVEEVRMKSPDEKLLERVMAVINKNIGNSDLSVDMIAQEVGISRVHLHRKMKELTNQTPHDFIRNLRLKQAANLLASQHHNVTEVMYACGFSNSASFSTMFRKFYGMSPRDYMKEHQK